MQENYLINFNFPVVDDHQKSLTKNGNQILAKEVIVSYLLAPSFIFGKSNAKYVLALKINKNDEVFIADQEFEILNELLKADDLVPCNIKNCLRKHLN